MKTVKIKKPWHDLIMSMSIYDIKNSYYGSYNLTAGYLNDYSEKSINGFTADFLESLNEDDLFFEEFKLEEVLNKPDIILQYAANMLVSYLDWLKLVDNPENLLCTSNWHGKCSDKLVILKTGECFYIVNTIENPENAFNDVITSIDADDLAFEVVAVIIGEQ